MPPRAARRSAAAAEPSRPRLAFPGPAALAAPALALLVLLAAPPGANAFWGVNGLRSVAPGVALALVSAALAAAVWAARVRLPGALVAALAALALAAPLHEAGHFLGDTFVRWRTLAAVAEGGGVPAFGDLARQLHAQPLDDALGVWGPAQLVHRGVSVEHALVLPAVLLAAVFFAGLRGVASRLAPGAATGPFVALLATAGSLEVFARYAESGGPILAFGALWWFALLRPMERRRDAVLTALAWFGLALAHRVALVALLPQVARATVVRLDGDSPSARRDLLLATLAAAVLAALAVLPGAGAALARDEFELGATLGRCIAPADLANLLAVTMPLALLAPWIAGREAVGAFARSPLGALHAIAFVPLTPLLLFYPMAAHGLGPHRDWELALLPGLVATSAAAAMLARLDAARRRGAVAVLLPVLVLMAGAWAAVNGDAAAVQRRAVALVSQPGGATGEQRGHALVYLGYHASDVGDDAGSARWFDSSYETLPNARTELLAAESWLRAGDTAAARTAIARVRARGGLEPALERGIRVLEGMAAQQEAASGRRTVP